MAAKLSPDQQQSKAIRAGAALVSKKVKTPLEDALAAKGATGFTRSVELCRWMREQFDEYYSKLATWRTNRDRYAAESQDVFEHRKVEYERQREASDTKAFFEIRNDSLNLVGSMAEFASAQAEQDLFGGEPWFAAQPVGVADEKLATTIQRHWQWTLRDGELVKTYRNAIPIAAALGEAFTLTSYAIETDTYEAPRDVLHANGKPVQFEGKYVADEDLTEPDEEGNRSRADGKPMAVIGNVDWRKVFETRQITISEGVDTCILHHNDIAFREDAPSLDLKHTNFYVQIEMSVSDAIKRFNLSPRDGIRLAKAASLKNSANLLDDKDDASIDASRIEHGGEETSFGFGLNEQLLNSRIRLIMGFVRLDPFGDGITRRLVCVFPPSHEDWVVWCDYLGNMTPKAALPVHCHVWEAVPHKLYGRGFFAKYRNDQSYVDDLMSQVRFRNGMNANPITGVHPQALESDDEEPNIEIKPGATFELKENKRLTDFLEFGVMPDADNRSVELVNMRIQMAQLRSGISSASQGDMSSLPENNTATGIRQLMSRAAVLLKKPIRGLRTSFNAEFSFTTRLFYANFDRDEAFVWGEGENVEMVTLSADQVRNLDIDVRMLLTQEQNQTKLEGAQVATGLFAQWIAIPEIEKNNARPLYLQAMKALEFDQADTIIRQAAPTLIDAVALLPKEQQQGAIATIQAGEQVMAAAQMPAQAMPPPNGTQTFTTQPQ